MFLYLLRSNGDSLSVKLIQCLRHESSKLLFSIVSPSWGEEMRVFLHLFIVSILSEEIRFQIESNTLISLPCQYFFNHLLQRLFMQSDSQWTNWLLDDPHFASSFDINLPSSPFFSNKHFFHIELFWTISLFNAILLRRSQHWAKNWSSFLYWTICNRNRLFNMKSTNSIAHRH